MTYYSRRPGYTYVPITHWAQFMRLDLARARGIYRSFPFDRDEGRIMVEIEDAVAEGDKDPPVIDGQWDPNEDWGPAFSYEVPNGWQWRRVLEVPLWARASGYKLLK